MCFRQAGLQFLYGEALASLRKEEINDGMRYEVTIDADNDNLDELNEVWHLDTNVITLLKQETGNRRVVVIDQSAVDVVEQDTESTNVVVVDQATTVVPFGVGCRDHDTRGLKTNLEIPLNPVLTEEPYLQKFPVRAGIRHHNPACPHILQIDTFRTHYVFTQPVTETQVHATPPQTAKDQTNGDHRVGRGYLRQSRITSSRPQGDSEEGPPTITAYTDAGKSYGVQPCATLISLRVNGVIHYDSTT